MHFLFVQLRGRHYYHALFTSSDGWWLVSRA